jgi:spore germination protein KA
MVETVKKQLQSTGLDMVFDPGYLTPFVIRTPFSLFTPAGFTERPDTAAAKLCEGKLVVLVNGSPYAMILPHFFCEHFQSMDDYLQRPYFSSFIRLLKYAAFFVSVLLPGVFVAAADFTPELLSSTLLYTLAAAQSSTPLPLFWEVFLVNLLLEVIREAGLRLPSAIGHAVSLVAALIVGDAAVQIGLLGTPVLVICALAGLCSYVVPSLYEPGIVLRLVFLLAGGLAGPVGMAMLGCLCLLDVCRPSPFGIPYTAPVSPYSPSLWRDGLLRASWRKLVQRRLFSVRGLLRGKRRTEPGRRSKCRFEKGEAADGKDPD